MNASKFIALTVMLLVLVAAVGCQNKNKVQKNASVTDINIAPVAPREPSLAYAGPITAAPQPDGFYEPAVTQTPAAGSANIAGGAYTVRKGDTLFSIAKQSYGNGNQWQRIASANPGLSPSTLKAGQKIMIP